MGWRLPALISRADDRFRSLGDLGLGVTVAAGHEAIAWRVDGWITSRKGA